MNSNYTYNNSPIFKSWNVIYPVFIYFVVTNLAMTLFAMLASFLGAEYRSFLLAVGGGNPGAPAGTRCKTRRGRRWGWNVTKWGW